MPIHSIRVLFSSSPIDNLTEHSMAQKIIFDTDPGIDDAMAILFALGIVQM